MRKVQVKLLPRSLGRKSEIKGLEGKVMCQWRSMDREWNTSMPI